MKLKQIYEEIVGEEQVMSDIKSRVKTKHLNQYLDDNGWEREDADDAFADYLYDEFQISVDVDGLIDFETLTNDVRRIIGDNAVKLYHFAPKKYLTDIKRDGLVSGKTQTNPHQNSYAGIYLTTQISGNAIDGYIHNINQRHGEAVVLTVKTTLNKLSPDPDDEGLASGKTQFIIKSVPPSDILHVEDAH